MSFRTIVSFSYILFIFVQIYFTKKSITTVRTVFPSIKRKAVIITSTMFSILFYLYPLTRLLHSSFGIDIPENNLYDYLILYPFWFLLVIIGQSMALLIPLDLIKLILYPLYKKNKPKAKIYYFRFTLAVISICTVYAPIRIIIDHNCVEVRNIDYVKNNLPNTLKDFKIAFISDVQADRFTNDKRLGNYIKKVNETNPDIILIAGDLITGSPDFIEYSANQLAKLRAKYGVFSCVGDHDNWSYRSDIARSRREMTQALAKHNIMFGDNERVVLNVDTTKINITFITNTYSEQVSQLKLDSLSNGKLNCALKIFLTHQPREHLLTTAIENDYDLYLCGHTHGGQISIYTPFGYLSPTLVETTRVRGDFRFNNLLMVVTRGLGYSLAPIRYNSTPEIVTITLK